MKKYGFTLVEVLGVIILLAILALIATPIILGLMTDTKKNAFVDTAYGITQAARNAYVGVMYAGDEPQDILFTYENGEEVAAPGGYALSYDGGKPSNGRVALNKAGKVALAIHDGTWCVTKDFTDTEVTVEAASLADCNALMDGFLNAG